jgi:hypothetical protein
MSACGFCHGGPVGNAATWVDGKPRPPAPCPRCGETNARPRLLDLFCGAGGCSVGYALAGFEVVGVDLFPQPNYPFKFWQHDALSFLPPQDIASNFDAIHASPPCQAHSSLKAVTRHIEHQDLVAETREQLEATGLPYVIENVPGAPLENYVQLCGSSFGLDVRRHRLFETNWPLMVPPCSHDQQTKEFRRYQHGEWYTSPVVAVYGSGGGKAQEHWAEAMGIDWMTHREMAQAIPPAYTEFVGEQLIAHLAKLEKVA